MKSRWIYYMPIHLLELLITIVNNCSWSNNLCIMTVDIWSWSTYLNYGPHSKLLRKVNNSWIDTTFLNVNIPLVKGNLPYVSHEITLISIALLRGACTHWEWNYDTLQCGWGSLSHKFLYESTQNLLVKSIVKDNENV